MHIFEERYRAMVGEAEARGTEFGIVRTMADGEENRIAGTGCTVVVESVVNRYPDGRFDVVTRGRRRFEIVSLDDAEPCLRGTVEYFDDDQPPAPVPDELVSRALAAHDRLRQELSPGEDASPMKPAQHELSFHLAEKIDDLDFRSLMLQCRSEPERLRLFAQFTDGYIPRRQYVAHMQKKAPTNGSGHKRPLS